MTSLRPNMTFLRIKVVSLPLKVTLMRPLMISIISLRSLMAWLRPLRLLVISLNP